MRDDLEPLEPWLGGLLSTLEAGPRRRLLNKVMQALRRSQGARIARNEQPDGTSMADRKPRKTKKKGRIKRKAKMFRKLRLVRWMKINADDDSGELSFKYKKVGQIAAENHFGHVAFIGKTPSGRTIKARMTERRLLGFSNDDSDAILDAVTKHLDDGID